MPIMFQKEFDRVTPLLFRARVREEHSSQPPLRCIRLMRRV
jgi:type VI protein secretion system component Hcp